MAACVFSSITGDHLDGDILITLCHNNPHRWWHIIRVFKAVVHCPQRILHLQENTLIEQMPEAPLPAAVRSMHATCLTMKPIVSHMNVALSEKLAHARFHISNFSQMHALPDARLMSARRTLEKFIANLE